MKTNSDNKKVSYGIIKPETISEEEFNRLNSSPDFIQERLKKSLENLPGIDTTTASSPQKALTNYFFKSSSNRTYSEITAKSLSKIFSPEAEKYAFEIPSSDDKDLNGVSLTRSQADMMRAAELASEISEQRGETHLDQYRDIAIGILEIDYLRGK